MVYGEALSSASELQSRPEEDLLARMIYSEASVESEAGKRGVAYVAKNRKDKNSSEFGGNTVKGVLLKENQFLGLTTSNGLRPDTSSNAWKKSLEIALNLDTMDNPIGRCLWFNTHASYEAKMHVIDGIEYYEFPGTEAREVIEKYELGAHTFFRLSGY